MDTKVLIGQLVNQFTKLNRSQQLIIIGTITAVVGFIVFLILYNSKPDSKDGYKILFDKLSPTDAGLVVGQLEKDNIEYEIVNDTTIMVPQEHVYKERIAIAALGIPKDNRVGFELFNTQEFGATSFDQNVKYLRAIEGELSRTIEALRPIENATVHLALPKESVFVSKQVEPTASVAVTLKEDSRLTRKQVIGIKYLVSASIPKMKSENVTVIDADGVPLGDGDEFTESSEQAKAQMLYKKRLEHNYEEKIVKVLSPFIGGDDRVVAKVSMEFDFSQKSSVEELYDPENIVRSEQVLEEKREGFKPKELGGVPGAVSNIGPVEGLDSKETSEKYSKNKTSTNYEISKKTSNTKGEFATLKRLTAAVVVDGKYEPKVDAEGNPTSGFTYVALDATQLDAISRLVKQSIGIDPKRGDEVTVSNFSFESSQVKLTPKDGYEGFMGQVTRYMGPIAPLIKYLIVGLILFIFYKKVIVPFAERMLEIQESEEELDKPLLDLDEEEEEDLVSKVQAMRKKVEDQLGVNDNFNEEALKYDVLLEKLRTIVEDRPEEVSTLLTVLIEEETINLESFDLKGGAKS